MHISARLSGRSRSRDLTLPEWFAAFTATTGAALRQVRLHHPIPAPGPVSIARCRARSLPILDTACYGALCTECIAVDSLLHTSRQDRGGYALCAVLYDLDHHNRRGADLRSVGSWARSDSASPEDKERSDLSHSGAAIRLARPADRDGTACPVSGVLHRPDVDLGGFRLLRLFDVYQCYADGPRPFAAYRPRGRTLLATWLTRI